jgi:Ca2+-binding EF-hand superfamily protein
LEHAVQAVAKMFEKNYEHLIKAKANLDDEENEFDKTNGNKDCILDGKEWKNFEKHKQEKKKQSEADRDAQRLEEEKRKEEQKKQLLERFDKDGDGKLNETELAAAQRALDLEAKERAILARYDKNSDGNLDETERALAEEELRGLVNAADTNRDGMVSDQELFKSIKELRGRMDEKLKEELQKRFPGKADFDKEWDRIEQTRNERFKKMRDKVLKKFDTNGSGDIDGDERAAVIEYLKHHKNLGPAFSDLETEGE